MRQRIIHQVRCEQLPILIVNKIFKERPAQTLCDPAEDLAFDLRRVDSKADILHGKVIKHAHLAGSGIDCYFRHVYGIQGRACPESGTTTPIDGFIFTCKAHRGRSDIRQLDTLSRRAANDHFVSIDLQI